MNPRARFHREIRELKCRLIAEAVAAHGGNRTYAAEDLGIERTYLMRLIRQLKVSVPTAQMGGRR